MGCTKGFGCFSKKKIIWFASYPSVCFSGLHLKNPNNPQNEVKIECSNPHRLLPLPIVL
ncbi:hypothetical protein HanXRQr2_Chr16g0752041 [Helianthus annuus]|uniref:Uncharacterized protein n=1 Tax=Helianthus annuus TaxID=4232 RepID=A0A9K3GYC8_HELAN|nr:hypothetical protein HanXRQr2_Chr16g0752041 [Helianthus annuus]